MFLLKWFTLSSATQCGAGILTPLFKERLQLFSGSGYLAWSFYQVLWTLVCPGLQFSLPLYSRISNACVLFCKGFLLRLLGLLKSKILASVFSKIWPHLKLYSPAFSSLRLLMFVSLLVSVPLSSGPYGKPSSSFWAPCSIPESVNIPREKRVADCEPHPRDFPFEGILDALVCFWCLQIDFF